MPTETDIRIARAVALKAAVELVNGKAILLADLEGRAEELTGFLLNQEARYVVDGDPSPTHQVAPPSEEPMHVSGNALVGQGDITQNCPDHPGQSADSKFEGQHRWCRATTDEGKCDWTYRTFVNDNGQGGVEKVDRWKYHGAWHSKPDYINVVQGAPTYTTEDIPFE